MYSDKILFCQVMCKLKHFIVLYKMCYLPKNDISEDNHQWMCIHLEFLCGPANTQSLKQSARLGRWLICLSIWAIKTIRCTTTLLLIEWTEWVTERFYFNTENTWWRFLPKQINEQFLSTKGMFTAWGKLLHESKWETGKKHSVVQGIRDVLHVNCRGQTRLSAINSIAD